jgi:uncharacterized protein YutE (UPF0331/DUF86 family)
MQIDKCVEEIKNELELIDELIESHESLLKKATTSTPNRIEISAIGTVLHSFYNGVENIFERIAKRIDQQTPSSEFWHQELLEQMKEDTPNRNAVISNELNEKLKLYLGFRHFFRHSYPAFIKWEKIKDLTHALYSVYNQLKDEINTFIKSLTDGGNK